jgi:hypothetical protein
VAVTLRRLHELQQALQLILSLLHTVNGTDSRIAMR